ncbi:MAG: hypothetical protein QW273_02705 [Candidatus Pacearchaeota archaeon]
MVRNQKNGNIREVKEELGLKVKKAEYIFSYVGPIHRNKFGKLQQNFAKVFLLNVESKPKPSNEINQIAYWKPNSKIKFMKMTKEVLNKYLEYKKKKPK